MKKQIFVLIALSFLLYGFGRSNQVELQAKGDNKMVAATAKIEVTSVFKEKEKIPAKYTCSEQDISPPLNWRNAPEKTVSFALIMDDPDAPMGTWVHWVMWNIPADQTELKENVAKQSELTGGIKQGTNSGGKIGYMGPCPPSGVHRYYFKLYALDTKLQFEGKVTKEKLLEAMEGHILSEGTLMGLYDKK